MRRCRPFWSPRVEIGEMGAGARLAGGPGVGVRRLPAGIGRRRGAGLRSGAAAPGRSAGRGGKAGAVGDQAPAHPVHRRDGRAHAGAVKRPRPCVSRCRSAPLSRRGRNSAGYSAAVGDAIGAPCYTCWTPPDKRYRDRATSTCARWSRISRGGRRHGRRNVVPGNSDPIRDFGVYRALLRRLQTAGWKNAPALSAARRVARLVHGAGYCERARTRTTSGATSRTGHGRHRHRRRGGQAKRAEKCPHAGGQEITGFRRGSRRELGRGGLRPACDDGGSLRGRGCARRPEPTTVRFRGWPDGDAQLHVCTGSIA